MRLLVRTSSQLRVAADFRNARARAAVECFDLVTAEVVVALQGDANQASGRSRRTGLGAFV